MDIKVPQLAEGVETATVVNILVSEGDDIQKDQTIMELETEKAVGPIPSPASGKVAKIHVREGDQVTVGQRLISLHEGDAEREAERRAETKTSGRGPAAAPAEARGQRREEVIEDYQYDSKGGFSPPAPPSIRKMAQQLGIDLTRVKGTERGGRITLADLKAYLRRLQTSPHEGRTVLEKPPPRQGIDYARWGPTRRERVTALRRTIAEKTYEAWSTIPHVTQCDDADITRLMELRKKYAPLYEKKGARLTLTSFALKAAVVALKKYPIFNSSLDEAAQEIVYKDYYHIGVAVDTESGLIVPTIRDVDKKSLLDLSIELAALAERARQRKVSLEELQGGTFTISNLGGIGGSYFTPIVNKPQVAVIGLGRSALKPVVRNKRTEARMLLPLGLSYDHRVIDGADGARFAREIAQALENFSETELQP